MLDRVIPGLRQVAFLTAPTFVGYVVFGLLIVSGLFQTGRFGLESSWLVYLTVAGYSLGLLATTASRLLQNTFYALGDTKTPAKIAAARVSVSLAGGVPLMLWLDRFPVERFSGVVDGEQPLFLGIVGLACASALGAWLELGLLRRALGKRLPSFRLPVKRVAIFVALAMTTALPALLLWHWLPILHPALTMVVVVGFFALAYLVTSRGLGFSEMGAWLGRVGRSK